MRTFVTLALLGCLLILHTGCGSKPASKTFQEDVEFLKKYTDVIVLGNGNRRIAVVPQYQGRVMTSTVSAENGPSFGWLNYDVIEKGLLPEDERKGQLQDHIYVFGGEERFWIGPEGGQFGIYFKPGVEFTFDNWHTPPAIDTLPYRLLNRTDDTATFLHRCELLNYSGTKFSVGIRRTIRVLDDAAIKNMLKQSLPKDVQAVAYESENIIKNDGTDPWTKETGMLSIWILGMYKPSKGIVVVIPINEGPAELLGPAVNDSYFGNVPRKYLNVTKDTIFFKGDGTRRGKIGISEGRSKAVAGSYDMDGKVLTLVTCNVPEQSEGYVNSVWEIQDTPFSGDAINSYNDGSPGEGKPPLGPFYEIETSSPAAALKPGQAIRHVQRTIHITGKEKELDPIARSALGVSLDEIKRSL